MRPSVRASTFADLFLNEDFKIFIYTLAFKSQPFPLCLRLYAIWKELGIIGQKKKKSKVHKQFLGNRRNHQK